MPKVNSKILKTELEYWESNTQTDPVSADRLLEYVEDIIHTGGIPEVSPRQWGKYLDLTRRTLFLNSLDSRSKRNRWAETTFRIIDGANFNLRALIKQRVELHPDKPLFKLIESNKVVDYSYKWAGRRVKQIAAALLKLGSYNPRVAIYSENTLESACTDIACLSYDIFDSPLNIHFGLDTLEYIFRKININIAVTDTEQRLNTLLKLREKTGLDFKIVFTGYGDLKSEYIDKTHSLDKLITLHWLMLLTWL
jgi:hypothetical protein